MNVEKTTSITIGEKSFVVADLPKELQVLIAVFDEWRQDEQDAKTEMLKCAAAVRDLQREMYDKIVQLKLVGEGEEDEPEPQGI